MHQKRSSVGDALGGRCRLRRLVATVAAAAAAAAAAERQRDRRMVTSPASGPMSGRRCAFSSLLALAEFSAQR